MTQYGAEETFRTVKAAFSPWHELLLPDAERRLRAAIAPLGLVNQKAPRVVEVARRLSADFGDVTLDPLRGMGDAEAEQYLTTLPGVGLKVARCVLMYSLGRDACPVDTHVYRIARRTGLVAEGTTYAQAHEAMHRAVPPDLRYGLHVGFVRLGRTTCKARRPRCASCPLGTAKVCHYASAQTP